MIETQDVKYYSVLEEKINVFSHAIGVIISFVALAILVRHAAVYGSILHVVSMSIYGASLIVLYMASTFYHRAKSVGLRRRMRIFDHASIYILIAGTYTPFSLITINGQLGWVIFGLAWGLALFGVVVKILFTGKYRLISTLTYIVMGWMIVFFIRPLMNTLPVAGLLWLVAGGVLYTLGAVLYNIKIIPLNHAVFHVFVLMGSFTHFISVFFYVLPQ